MLDNNEYKDLLDKPIKRKADCSDSIPDNTTTRGLLETKITGCNHIGVKLLAEDPCSDGPWTIAIRCTRCNCWVSPNEMKEILDVLCKRLI